MMEFTEPMDFTGDTMLDSDTTTPMRDYYRGKTIFLTGGTGFLGQLYVEKLLRCEVKWIYLLARSKKGKSIQERLQETYTGTHFSKLLQQDPEYLKRIKVIEGDLSQIELGISKDDQKDIFENVEIVLHAAADVRFDEKLNKLLMVNLRGTKELLKLTESIKQLQVFSYISTAYSHCPKLNIDEKFYDAPVDPNVMIKFSESMADEDQHNVEILTQRIINPWPNTYTYTKSLSEEVVRQYGQKFPVCIIRPTIVISTHEDPIPAWCNNIYGLNGVLVACGMGVLRLMPLKNSLIGDVVCADFVINSTLAAIWVTHENTKDERREVAVPRPDPEIYHVSTYTDRPVLWGQISKQMNDMFCEYPAKRMLWKHCPNSVTCPFMWKYLTLLYHVLPATMFDLVSKWKDNPIRVLPVYRKVQRFMDALKYFMQREWRFSNANMKRVLARMSKEDQEYFPSDVRRYDWMTFSYNYLHGLKHYIGMESIQDIPEARIRYRRLVILHYLVLVVYYGVHIALFSLLGYKLGIYDYFKNSFFDTVAFLKNPQ